MKTKKLLLITFIQINLLTLNIFSNPKHTNIDYFLNRNNSNPVIFSIKQTFANQYLNNSSKNFYKDDNNSKTSLFNKYFFDEYVKNVYNNRHYADVLSQNGKHVIEFLQMCKELNVETELAYTGLRLFYNKIKSCELIDYTVILQVLKPLPELLGSFLSTEDNVQDFSFLKINFEKILLNKFTEHLPKFESEPDIFLHDLSKDLAKKAKEELIKSEKEQNEKEMKERLRQMTVKFLEIALSKTIWEPTHYESIWSSVNEIASLIYILGDRNILEHMDDLDDLIWSLVHRFCFFLDFTGSILPTQFYELVETEINNNMVFFLETPELDEGIKSKKEFILDALSKAKVKALAFERGIISDSYIV